jgi:hypothetical protein
MDNLDLIILVITVPLKISLIPKSKCVVTVLKDSNITLLPIAVIHVLCIKSSTELVDYRVTVWRTVLNM